MRRLTRGGGAYLIIALFSVPLALVGYEWLSPEDTGDFSEFALVIVDGDEEITVGEIRRRSRFLLDYREDFESFTESELNEFTLMVAERMTDEVILSKQAHRRGMRTPVEVVNKAILQSPWFQPEGQFSPNYYKGQLSRFGYTPIAFRDTMSRLSYSSQLLSAYQYGVLFPDDTLKRWTEWYEREREVDYLVIRDTDLLDEVDVEADAITAEYEENGENYLTNDTIKIKYFTVGIEDYRKEVPAERVEEEFQRELALLRDSQNISHILLGVDDNRSDDDAVDLLENLRADHERGADFSELAREYSEDYVSREQGGYLGDIDKDLLPQAFLDALDGLAPGSVSEPVRTELGWHLIYYPGGADVDEDELRAEVLARLQDFRDKNVYNRQLDGLREEVLGVLYLEDLLASFPGKSMEYSPLLNREGIVDDEGASNVAIFENLSGLVDAMFAQEILNNEVTIISVDEGTTLVVQLDEYTPVRQMTLEEARWQIEDELRLKAARELMPGYAAEVAEELQDALNRKRRRLPSGYDWQSVSALKRYDREHQNGGIASLVFALPAPADDKPRVLHRELTQSSYAVLALNAENEAEADEERSAEIARRFRLSAGYAYSRLYNGNLTIQHELEYPVFRQPN